jgi:hypothetical protein
MHTVYQGPKKANLILLKNSGVCYNEQCLSIKSVCYNDRGGILSAAKTAFVQCLLKMGKWCPKHVEALNPNKSESESKVCIKLVESIPLL